MARIIYMKDGEADGTSRISVDGEYIDSKNFVDIVASNIHAIQWYDSKGEIEYNDGKGNEDITDISSYDFEAKYNAEKKVIEDAEATVISNRTYAEKRAIEYPSIADQLDDIYHNGIDGWKTTIKAVKDKYPKG
tara:strand:- start:47 stop:448 length:402 start_codon:yes stop_codon:yes gene_type:complete